MASSQFSVSWEAYQKNICKGLSALQQKGEFVDMTITADGHHVKVHQMVLSLVSPYIKELIKSAQCPHPVIFLNRVSHQTLQSILEYAYTGEVLVTQEHLSEFLEACKALCIKGLENVTRSKAENTEGQQEENNSTNKHEIFKTEYISMDGVNFSDADDDDKNKLVAEQHNPLFASRVKNKKKSQNSAMRVTKTPVVQPAMIQYSISVQGFLQVVINRFLYSLRHMRKNNERYWRCTFQQKLACLAAVVTKDNEVLERVGAHNHPFHDHQIQKRKCSNNLYLDLNEADEAAKKKRKLIQATKDAKELLNIHDNEKKFKFLTTTF